MQIRSTIDYELNIQKTRILTIIHLSFPSKPLRAATRICLINSIKLSHRSELDSPETIKLCQSPKEKHFARQHKHC